tara:strand:+ start:1354 stop:1590 length:237 start_codon:yes stop_codon:yes gene_type:complete
MSKLEKLKEEIEFLENVIEKQNRLLFYYSKQEDQKNRSKELIQTDKQYDIDKDFLDRLKEMQDIVIMRKSERGWRKYE